MERPTVHESELEYQGFPGGVPDFAKETFGGTIGQIGMRLGAQKIGANITRVPSGKRAFPFHSHRVNEELFFILEGSGELRLGKERHPVREGDFILCPPGGPETAHQLINTGPGELRYLAISSKLSPEIAEYPDSGKFGVLAENFRFLGRAGESLGYWEGEG